MKHKFWEEALQQDVERVEIKPNEGLQTSIPFGVYGVLYDAKAI